MLKTRVIPVLLLQNNGLVKTKKFTNPTYIGDPVNAVKIFNLKEVDELIFLDINASADHTEPDYELIADIASEAFMPFSYGGGISRIEQIRKLLRIGVEKVILNTSLQDEDFVRDAVRTFGTSTIVASIDIYKNQVYRHVSRFSEAIDVVEYIKRIEHLGVGEIMMNSVDRDGCYTGYDIETLKMVATSVNVPVIACGGARGLGDIETLIRETECSAAAAGSMFVFYGKYKAVLITYPDELDLVNLYK